MPPTVHLVRHGEAEHNPRNDKNIRDPLLTDTGRLQCEGLGRVLKTWEKIDLILTSPLRRAVQTAVLAFPSIVADTNVPFLLLPAAQEIGAFPANVGCSKDELRASLQDALGPRQFDIDQISFEYVDDEWNSKTGYWAADPVAIERRAQDLRNWLFSRPESQILLITHGGFLHFLTEDWSGYNKDRGTGYANCEARTFQFTTESTESSAHLVESDESRESRMRHTDIDKGVFTQLVVPENRLPI